MADNQRKWTGAIVHGLILGILVALAVLLLPMDNPLVRVLTLVPLFLYALWILFQKVFVEWLSG